MSLYVKSDSIPLDVQFQEVFEHLTRTSLQQELDPASVPAVRKLSKQLGFMPEEIVVMAAAFGLYKKGRRVPQLKVELLTAPYFHFRSMQMEAIDRLIKYGFFTEVEMEGKDCYQLPRQVYQSVLWDKPEALIKLRPVGLERMLEYFHTHVLNRNSTYDEVNLMEEFSFLSEMNEELTLSRQVLGKMSTMEAFVVMAVCANKLFYDVPFDSGMLRKFFGVSISTRNMLRAIAAEKCVFILSGHIRITGSGLVDDEPQLELTEAGIDYYLQELPRDILQNLLRRDMRLPAHAIKANQIDAVKLIFDAGMQRQADDLKQLMMPAFYERYQRSLSKHTRMRGITVLFYGVSGTGKTELALQLARQSKRDLFRFDVGQILSKWVGDSEKNLKSRLREYRYYQQQSEHPPILFLNECDQLLSKRLNITQSVDQMRNTMQNILLEELETFEGILIATTNMTMNLDPAFERRFLYKVRFNAPDRHITAQLWKLALPRLSAAQADTLAAQFAFMPGEMQNIAVKLRLRRMLQPRCPYFETAMQLCREEKWGESLVQLGFRQN